MSYENLKGPMGTGVFEEDVAEEETEQGEGEHAD